MAFYSDYWDRQKVYERSLLNDTTPKFFEECECEYHQTFTMSYTNAGTDQNPLYKYSMRYESYAECREGPCFKSNWSVGLAGSTQGGGSSGGLFVMQKISCGGCKCKDKGKRRGHKNFFEDDEGTPVGKKGLPSEVRLLVDSIEDDDTVDQAEQDTIVEAAKKKIDGYTDTGNGGTGSNTPTEATVTDMCKGMVLIP